MEPARTELRFSPPSSGSRFSWPRLAVWLPGCAIGGGLIASAAVEVESHFAPIVIFSLLVGVGLGALVVALMRVGQVGHRPTVVLGTVLAVLVTVAGQHYLAYLDYRASFDVSRQKSLPAGSPVGLSALVEQWIPTFPEFMRQQAARGRPLARGWIARDWAAWLSWGVDGLLVLGATLAVVIPTMRQPYCNRCRTWYRTVRSGRINVAAARRLADAAGLPAVDRPLAARYYVLSCQGGCGPLGLDLSWDESPRGTSLARTWLDSDRRDRVTQLLDELVSTSRQPESAENAAPTDAMDMNATDASENGLGHS